MTSLIYINSLCFSNIFEFWCCTLFPQIYTEIENWDFEFCSRLDFPNIPMMKEIKTGDFKIRLCLVRVYLINIYCLLICILCVGEKTEAWFVFQANKEYFGAEYTAFMSANKLTKKICPLIRWTAKYDFFISEAKKIAS